MHKVTRGRRQCSRGAYTPSSDICSLGEELRGVHLLPRRGKYTRVYTTVYPPVHNSVHACTLQRSRYVLCGALSYALPRGQCLDPL